VSWRRVLARIEGLGNRNAKSLAEKIANRAEPDKQLIAAVKVVPKLSPNAIDGCTRLAGLLGQLRTSKAPAADQLEQVLKYYAPIMRASPKHNDKRKRDLEQLEVLARDYTSLEEMVTDLALEPPEDSAGDGVMHGDNAEARVILSTIHSAKGLEWRYVFIIWVAEGRFPFYKSVSDEELEEERRLLYVAITRSQDGLYLTYPAQMQDRLISALPSRFLETISATILPSLALKEGSPPQRNQNLH
jgi:DNA helicase-2/ATP-dependent DNA helicase PcrA